MDNAEPVPRRAEIRGSHESLAASSPSTSVHLGTGAGQQSRPGAFVHQGRGQEGFPKQARAEGLAGGEGGGAYADPDDVEVNLEGQDSAWGEENDILSYVQSKVCMLHQLFQSQNVYLNSETSSLHRKPKLINVWGEQNRISTLWRCFSTLPLSLFVGSCALLAGACWSLTLQDNTGQSFQVYWYYQSGSTGILV